MSLVDHITKAKTLVEALPYIKKFSGKTIVVKYGGSLLSNKKSIEQLSHDVALLRFVGMKPIIVHGGGREIDKWLKRFGKEPRLVDGEQFTDAETLEIIDMVLSGNISNTIVSSLTRCGVRAIGLSGRDGQLFTTRRIKSDRHRDMGYIGEIESIDPTVLLPILDKNYIPVISSVGMSREGSVLNVESDFVAAKVASALKAEKLFYLTSTKGIEHDGSLKEYLDLNEAEKLIESQELKPSASLKLRATIMALKGGVTDVHIISGNTDHSVLLEIFTDKGIGTMISNQKMRI